MDADRCGRNQGTALEGFRGGQGGIWQAHDTRKSLVDGVAPETSWLSPDFVWFGMDLAVSGAIRKWRS
jgi:hypothetical protein